MLRANKTTCTDEKLYIFKDQTTNSSDNCRGCTFSSQLFFLSRRSSHRTLSSTDSHVLFLFDMYINKQIQYSTIK